MVVVRWIGEAWYYVDQIDGAVVWGERDRAAVMDDASAALIIIAAAYGDEADVVAETV